MRRVLRVHCPIEWQAMCAPSGSGERPLKDVLRVLSRHVTAIRQVGNHYRIVTEDGEVRHRLLTDPMTRGQLERLARFLSIPIEDFYL